MPSGVWDVIALGAGLTPPPPQHPRVLNKLPHPTAGLTVGRDWGFPAVRAETAAVQPEVDRERFSWR